MNLRYLEGGSCILIDVLSWNFSTGIKEVIKTSVRVANVSEFRNTVAENKA